MYSYIFIKELILNRNYNFKIDFKIDKWVWLAFIWAMITMGSSAAFLFLPIILIQILKRKNIISVILFSLALYGLMIFFGIDTYDRNLKVIEALITLDVNNIVSADHSASMRIAPFIVLMSMLSLSTVDGWFGHGIDYVSSFMSDFIPGVEIGYSGGGLLQLWMEYGFFCFFIFFVGSMSNIVKQNDRLSILFWFLIVVLSGVNNQIVWLCSILLFTNKYFLNFKLK